MLPIHEHRITHHLFVCVCVFFFNFLDQYFLIISVQVFKPLWLNLFLGILFFPNESVKGIYLISLFQQFILMSRNTPDFYVLVLYLSQLFRIHLFYQLFCKVFSIFCILYVISKQWQFYLFSLKFRFFCCVFFWFHKLYSQYYVE